MPDVVRYWCSNPMPLFYSLWPSCGLQDTGILTGIVKSLGRVSLDIASLQPLKTRRLRLPLRYNEKASKAHISVEVCYHQFLDVRPGSPSRLCRFNPTKRWAAAYVHVEVLSCTGLDEEEEVRSREVLVYSCTFAVLRLCLNGSCPCFEARASEQ